MTKKEWLEEQIMCDEWGRPPSLADVPLTIMTRKDALIKQGGDTKSINELWEKSKNVKNGSFAAILDILSVLIFCFLEVF